LREPLQKFGVVLTTSSTSTSDMQIKIVQLAAM
jgi:hypothetical protein